MKYKQFTMTIQLINNEIENIDQYIDDIFEMTQIQILPTKCSKSSRFIVRKWII